MARAPAARHRDPRARGRARARRHRRVVGALRELVQPRVERRERGLVVVRPRAATPAAGRPSAPSRPRRAARTSAPSSAGRRSGRGARRRRRAATRPGRRASCAPGAARSASRSASGPAAAGSTGSLRPRKPDGSDCSRASIQPATSPWSWLPASTSSSPVGPERRAGLARRTAPASVGRVAVRRLAQLEPVAEHDEPVDVAQRLDQRRAQLGPPQRGPSRSRRRGAGRRRRACAPL